MDIIYIKQLELLAVIGVYAHERKQPQRILIDIDMFVDIRSAALGDDIAKTTDYKAVVDDVSAYVCASSVQLVETLAENIAQHILEKFKIARVGICISKPDILNNAAAVGVSITRYSQAE